MAATISCSFSLYSSLDIQKHKYLYYTNTHLFKSHQKLSKSSNPYLLIHKFNHQNSTFHTCSSSQSPSESYFDDPPPKSSVFLTTPELDKFRILKNYQYVHEFKHGSLFVRVMEEDETDITVRLLSESFAESMMLPLQYVNVLGFLIKQYMIERRGLMPNTAFLELAGTVEVSFNKKGSNTNPPSPTPPKDSPYICNMTVKKQLRRKGIGWHLLKASEELIPQMCNSSREVYLHCRMIDTAPFSMYTKAGYNIIKIDSILVLLLLQRRKHLMCKHLPIYSNPSSEADTSSSEDYRLHEFPL
ncbi:hypothetical protein MKX01_021853 [Papaver californicum]|nr:hypothetical protein MKX01_021853 [Papaver californicum]